MKDLLVKEFNGQTLTVVMYKEEPHFIGKEVCEILDISNVSAFCNELDDDQKLVLKGEELRNFKKDFNCLISNDLVGKRTKNLIFLTESGFYDACLRSRKPIVKKFRKWVVKEVLPEIRKTGGYIDKNNRENKVDDAICKITDFSIENRKMIFVFEEKLQKLENRINRIENPQIDPDKIICPKINLRVETMEKIQLAALKKDQDPNFLIYHPIEKLLEQYSMVKPDFSIKKASSSGWTNKNKTKRYPIKFTRQQFSQILTIIKFFFQGKGLGEVLDEMINEYLDQKVVKLELLNS